MPSAAPHDPVHAPEFVAVILAATNGARLFPLSSSETPKHLLPIGGVPILLRLLDTVAAAGFESCVVVVAKDDIGTVPTLVNANGGQYELQASNNITDNGSGSTEFESVGSFSHPMAFLRKPSSGTSNNNNHKSSSSSSSSFFKVTVVPVSEDCAGSAEALKQLELLDSSNASAPSSPSSGKLLLLPSTSHVVVLPGDLVVLDPKALIQLVDAHRQGNILPSSKQHRHSAVTMLLADVGEQDEHGIPLKESAKQKKGGLARAEEDIEYIALSSSSSSCSTGTNNNSNTSNLSPRVVWKQSKMDVEEDDLGMGTTPKLSFPKARLRHVATGAGGGVTKVRIDWSDLHVYVISPWIRKCIEVRNKNHPGHPMVSLQGDVLPLLVTRQFQGCLATFFSEPALEQQQQQHKQVLAEVLSQPPFLVSGFDESGTITQELLEEQLMTDSNNNNHDNNNNNDLLAPLAHEYAVCAQVLEGSGGRAAAAVATASTGGTTSDSGGGVVALRASSVPAYLYACREWVTRAIAFHTSITTSNNNNSNNPCLTLPSQTLVQSKFQSILLAEAIVAGDKGSACKSSTVGRKTKLGLKCRLNNVVVMDNVTVGDNCVLQNSILGAGCTIGENCNLNDCQVGPGKTIPSGTKEKGESFFEDHTDVFVVSNDE